MRSASVVEPTEQRGSDVLAARLLPACTQARFGTVIEASNAASMCPSLHGEWDAAGSGLTGPKPSQTQHYPQTQAVTGPESGTPPQ